MKLKLKPFLKYFLQLPKYTETRSFTFKEIPEQKKVVPFEIADPSKTVTGKILGVNSIKKEARCSLCKRKARMNDDRKVYCEPCD